MGIGLVLLGNSGNYVAVKLLKSRRIDCLVALLSPCFINF
ncbi:hypothetical protein ADICYQ_0853 [Cyclobacterium qasimii M12-11B]|uniref:Uncharacterized protein n=1 Tax=Cyclobacterium qasimii M12-11B TaxID=641524 RepID=S7VNA6_9BACT|nr:hypothetical protein ADICYQ_0853 [Cyclobacterium qasimii M12-11B]